ncbi:hypothetical protein CRG98_038589 [Punica granatum]|uniref:DUF4219 domain-containing protein n=1 Tax=Punica granatum TaxID=22663 RepID=A0A2I0IAN3_PUNGR|nr:hypothetical protein CRG98_038589 [Punica granatum]
MATFSKRWSGPLLDRTNYPYWKKRIAVFVQALDYELWSVITEGKPSESSCKLGALDQTDAQLKARALNLLYSTIGEDVFKDMFSCTTAKEIWDLLESKYKRLEDEAYKFSLKNKL